MPTGNRADAVLRLRRTSTRTSQTGLANPLDEAILRPQPSADLDAR